MELKRQQLVGGGIGLAAVITVILALTFVHGKPEPVPAGSGDATPLKKTVTDGAPSPEPSRKTAARVAPSISGSTLAALDDIAGDVLTKYRDSDWKRAKFDGQALYFSPEDLAKAERIVARYGVNFAGIDRLSMTYTARRVLLDKNFEEKEEPGRSGPNPLADCTLRIEAVRSPLFFSMKGESTDGYEIEEIVTPAGETSGKNRTFGHAASLIPTYLDGEQLFIAASLLKYGHRVLENQSMDYDIPVLKEALAAGSVGDRRYDVIVQEKDNGFNNTYWFNCDSGMLDFYITERREPAKGEPRVYSAVMLNYYCHEGTYYFRDVAIYDGDCRIKSEYRFTDLVLNDKPINQVLSDGAL
jgi:hypothetical protein